MDESSNQEKEESKSLEEKVEVEDEDVSREVTEREFLTYLNSKFKDINEEYKIYVRYLENIQEFKVLGYKIMYYYNEDEETYEYEAIEPVKTGFHPEESYKK